MTEILRALETAINKHGTEDASVTLEYTLAGDVFSEVDLVPVLTLGLRKAVPSPSKSRLELPGQCTRLADFPSSAFLAGTVLDYRVDSGCVGVRATSAALALAAATWPSCLRLHALLHGPDRGEVRCRP